jgi:acetylornithine deacetylase/succinyl-diaminopimelate desuccinylase-like protein
MLPTPSAPEQDPNPIVRAAPLILAIYEWSRDYERKYRYESSCGEVIPKVAIGAIRGGTPRQFNSIPEICSLYLDCRIPPGQGPLSIKSELEGLLKKLGYDGRVEISVFRPGYEADLQRIDPLHQALRSAHREVFGRELEFAKALHISMWRDTNPYNQVGIPSLNYGPQPIDRTAIAVNDLLQAARVYALVAVNLCKAS